MNIITISREFGSGGRELGRQLADQLGYDYYDREIIIEVAKQRGLNPDYVEKALDRGFWDHIVPVFRHSFTTVPPLQSLSTELLIAQSQVLRGIAEAGRNCVIIGRSADTILREWKPLKLFVYADMPSKLRRCQERADPGERMSEQEMRKMIRQIDAVRTRTREIISGGKWGDRAGYHLLVNTSDRSVESLAPAVAEFARRWFEGK